MLFQKSLRFTIKVLFIFLTLTDWSSRLITLEIVSKICLVKVWVRNGYEIFWAFADGAQCVSFTLTQSRNTFNNISSVFLSMYVRVNWMYNFMLKRERSHWEWYGLSFVLSQDVIWLSPALKMDTFLLCLCTGGYTRRRLQTMLVNGVGRRGASKQAPCSGLLARWRGTKIFLPWLICQ